MIAKSNRRPSVAKPNDVQLHYKINIFGATLLNFDVYRPPDVATVASTVAARTPIVFGRHLASNVEGPERSGKPDPPVEVVRFSAVRGNWQMGDVRGPARPQCHRN